MPEGSPAPTVGARLREAREAKGLSLRQIATTTRISVASLEAVERGDLSRLPGGIFTRAFVRAYASEVGLDPDRTVHDYIAELPPEAAARATPQEPVEDGEKLESDRMAAATAVRLAFVSLPIIVLLAYLGSGGPAESPQESAPVRQKVVVPEVAAADSVAPAVAPPAARPSDLTMEIAPRGSCWVAVTADGDAQFARLMSAGDKQMVTAKDEILLNVGDAGTFAYTLNGLPGRPLGGPGQVVSRRITLTTLDEFVSP